MKNLDIPERQGFLAATRVAILSVAAEDGRPPATVPIWYDYELGGDIRFTTSASGRKVRLLKRAGSVSLAVQREQPPYQYVVVEGTIVGSEPTPRDFQEALAIRYLGDEGGRAFVLTFEPGKSTMFTVRPDRWITADFTGVL